MGKRFFSIGAPPPPPDFNLTFPEWEFPPLLARSEEYHMRNYLGSRRALDSTVCIVGCVRDVEEMLPINSRRIEKIGALFKDYRVFLAENDSIDTTADILGNWKFNNPRVDFISEKLGTPRLDDSSGERMNYMAIYRNKYLEYVKNNPNFDYVMVIDADFKGAGWSLDGIKNSMGWFGWDVISSNGLDRNRLVGGYYDILPLLIGGYEEEHQMTEYRYPYTNLVLKRGLERPKFQRSEPLFRVHSAFGGLAIYKTKAFLAGEKYSGELCDHSTLHRRMWAAGYIEHYINPSMIGLR